MNFPSEAGAEQRRYFVSTFYKFLHIKDVEGTKKALEDRAEQLGMRGLVILGSEGVNSTVAAPSEEAMELFKAFIRETFNSPEQIFKNSFAPSAPFRRFKVKIREEIVTLGTPELFPDLAKNHHLTPEEWNKVLKEESDFLLIDTRNWYETKIGTFKGAINPGIDVFTEFPQWLEEQNYSKDKKMLIFCTGGIRCEKGILELQRQGYNNVFQLEGGILKYIEDKPNDQFEGECFVFDHRVAVDQNLEPSKKYKLCPHCGQPAEIKINCSRCDTETLICEDCSAKPVVKETCTKNCAHQWELRPGRKGPRQALPFELEKGVLKGAKVVAGPKVARKTPKVPKALAATEVSAAAPTNAN